MEESKYITTDKNTTVQLTNIVYTTLCLETWTLSERLERRITAFEHKAYTRSMGITYRERKTNYYVYQIIVECICQVEQFLLKVKRRKMSYFGHTMCYDSLNKTVIQGCVFGKRRKG